MFKTGDYVVRKSYDKDILFRIVKITNDLAFLIGISFRISADAPLEDLELTEGMRYTEREDTTMINVDKNIEAILAKRDENIKVKMRMFQKPGTVLHIDGDPFYLKLCMKYYEKLGIQATGKHIPESEQARRIKSLIEQYNPSILVITGHDALNKNYKDLNDLNAYKNSKYYIEAVTQARLIRPNPGELVIFAGACQSDFEGLLRAGADFAASPSRVLIHALDPVFIVERIAYYPYHQVLGIEEVLKYTITGLKGLGGYETQGKCRRGGPVVLKEERQEDQVKTSKTEPAYEQEESQLAGQENIIESLLSLENMRTARKPYIWKHKLSSKGIYMFYM